MIRGWEAGDHRPGTEWQRAYSVAFGIPEDLLFAQEAAAPGYVPLLVQSPFSVGGDVARARLTVDEAERLLADLYRREAAEGGNALCRTVGEHVSAATRVFNHGSIGLSSERRLFGSIAGLSQMAGWLAVDANRHGDANRYLGAALYSAYEIDDLSLASHVMGYLSLSAFYQDNPRKALSLAKAGADLATADAQPQAVAILHTRAARAHARLGEDEDCKRRLDQATTALDSRGASREPPQWAGYISTLEMTAQQGACHLDLGDAASAITATTEAIRLIETRHPHHVRDLAHYKIRLATAYARSGEPEHAAELADQAHAITRRIGSARVDGRLRELLRTLDGYDSPGVRKVVERLMAR
ncbi:hypothetical protein EDD29_5054 [Actinocorallia herbida]|uniref:Transcriptional regulator n=1 Tax=Actinocorallia herbida TaxID=58109 RepID=A0A3N1D1R6_9ACTN|nr:hypothetical protein [Actinocorallia herbida]ROO87446.1 hypothetical protein EDD29_5054 [Actinocorallia herbida]